MSDAVKMWLLGLGIVALLVVCVVLILQRRDEQRACVERGGVVHEYNCQIVSCGRGCFSQTCDWQCVVP